MRQTPTEQHGNQIYKQRASASIPSARQPRPVYDDISDDDSLYETRMPTSARRYSYVPEGTYTNAHTRYNVRYAAPPPSRSQQRTTDDREAVTESSRREKRRVHWLFYVGIGMAVMVLLWFLGSYALTVWQIHQDDMTYGRPRTFHIDAVVGHNDSPAHPSHFIAINLNRHIVIFEIPGGDTSKTKIYDGPQLFGDGQDLIPVTLSFKDVNGDGKPDMLVHIQEQTIVFLNDNGSFRPAKPGEVNP